MLRSGLPTDTWMVVDVRAGGRAISVHAYQRDAEIERDKRNKGVTIKPTLLAWCSNQLLSGCLGHGVSCRTREKRDLSINGCPAEGIAGPPGDARGRCKAVSARAALYAPSGPTGVRGGKSQG